MPRTPNSRLLPLTVGTAASAGLGMSPLHRLPRAVQAGYVLRPAALTSGLLLRALLRREDLEGADGARQDPSRPAAGHGRRLPTVQETALCIAPGALLAGAAAGGILLDRGIENLLRRRGVAAPRVWIGLASGVLSVALTVLAERVPDPEGTEEAEEREDSEGGGPTSPSSAP